MSWIEEVRETLEAVEWAGVDYGACPWCGVTVGMVEGVPHAADCQRQKALAAIPDEPEMMKLLRVLDDPQDTFSHASPRAAILSVKKYIEREFGYKLEDE